MVTLRTFCEILRAIVSTFSPQQFSRVASGDFTTIYSTTSELNAKLMQTAHRQRHCTPLPCTTKYCTSPIFHLAAQASQQTTHKRWVKNIKSIINIYDMMITTSLYIYMIFSKPYKCANTHYLCQFELFWMRDFSLVYGFCIPKSQIVFMCAYVYIYMFVYVRK